MSVQFLYFETASCSYDLQNRQYQALRTNKNGFLDHLFIDV